MQNITRYAHWIFTYLKLNDVHFKFLSPVRIFRELKFYPVIRKQTTVQIYEKGCIWNVWLICSVVTSTPSILSQSLFMWDTLLILKPVLSSSTLWLQWEDTNNLNQSSRPNNKKKKQRVTFRNMNQRQMVYTCGLRMFCRVLTASEDYV